MKTPKFQFGDMVRIAKDLGSTMSHFEADQDAIVIENNFYEGYGNNERESSYSLLLCKDGNQCSWYNEHQLTFLRRSSLEEIQKIKSDAEARHVLESDIHYILKNWKKLRFGVPGATMGRLMELIGITNPWGDHGEAYHYYVNALATARLLDAALLTGDIVKLNKRLKQLGRPEVAGEVVGGVRKKF
jgi:hypothetical protein